MTSLVLATLRKRARTRAEKKKRKFYRNYTSTKTKAITVLAPVKCKSGTWYRNFESRHGLALEKLKNSVTGL